MDAGVQRAVGTPSPGQRCPLGKISQNRSSKKQRPRIQRKKNVCGRVVREVKPVTNVERSGHGALGAKRGTAQSNTEEPPGGTSRCPLENARPSPHPRRPVNAQCAAAVCQQLFWGGSSDAPWLPAPPFFQLTGLKIWPLCAAFFSGSPPLLTKSRHFQPNNITTLQPFLPVPSAERHRGHERTP